MRLMNAATRQVHTVYGDVPKYAALSHTWDPDPSNEVTFQDLSLPDIAARKPSGYAKIQRTCRRALADGLSYVWIDTCCIDKTGSAELTEAINSMFRWYKDSTLCYAYLADLPVRSDAAAALRKCAWFTRGWTLQELIAPAKIHFLDESWTLRGNKDSWRDIISDITNIDPGVLAGAVPLYAVAVGRRMSWAARRRTTRLEDIAYCLLGIFDVNMPMLYGEGSRAFVRLQEEIIKSTTDLSIFAWEAPRPSAEYSRFRGLLAKSPVEFSNCNRLVAAAFDDKERFSMTNGQVKLENVVLCLVSPRQLDPSGSFPPLSTLDTSGIFALPLNCSRQGEPTVVPAVLLRKFGLNLFARYQPHRLEVFADEMPSWTESIYVVSQLPEQHVVPSHTNSIAVSSRVAALQYSLPPGWATQSVCPRSLWDTQDKCFSTRSSLQRPLWCLVSIVNEDSYEKVIVQCKNWNTPEIEARFLNPDKAARLDINLWWNILQGQESDPEATGQLMEEWDEKIRLKRAGGVMRCSLAKISKATVCPTPFWTLSITFNPFSEDEADDADSTTDDDSDSDDSSECVSKPDREDRNPRPRTTSDDRTG